MSALHGWLRKSGGRSDCWHRERPVYMVDIECGLDSVWGCTECGERFRVVDLIPDVVTSKLRYIWMKDGP